MEATRKAIVVGCGGMGQAWIRNLQSNARAEIVGLVDLRQDVAKEIAESNGLDTARVFAGVGEAIDACDADFVVDVTVPEAHCPVTLNALGAGLPVIGEKPMAESMESARKMVAASEKSGKLYMVSQSRRYHVGHASCRQFIKSGVIGPVSTVNCDFYIGAHFGGFRDNMPSPLILDMAIHHFDLCRFLIDADPVAVYAHEFNPKGSWYSGDVAASVIFEMSDGIVFTYRGSWCAEGHPTSWNGDWRIIGDRGTVLMEKDRPAEAHAVIDMQQQGFHRDVAPSTAQDVEINGDGIAGSLNEFLDWLDNGATPQGECHDNIKSLAMVHAAIESSGKKQRQVIQIG